MLSLFRRSDKVSRKFARKINRYHTRVRLTGREDVKQLNKLMRKVKRHVRRRLPKDSPYRILNEDMMYKLRVTAFYNLDDIESDLIGIEDYCINEGYTDAEHDIHEVMVRIPIEGSILFVAFNFKYKVRRK